ncbi:MAG TPA: hypothetical protein VH165_09105 [Kofleriaceae bacterium]|nr:hypothetical protein [Kofleriaceae bacterium]
MKPHCSVSRATVRGLVARAAIAGALTTTGCAARSAHPIPIAVLLDGDPGAGAALPAVAGLAPHALVVPASPPEPPDDTAAPLARARKAYAAGELEACRAELAHVDVPRVLAGGRREVAARVLAFDAACAWGQQAQAAARGLAARLASFGLAVPDTAIAPDIEAILGDAIVAAGNAHPRPVRVRGEPGARLGVDGKPPACALPCTVDLVPGAHVLAATADGFSDAMREVRIPDITDVTLAQAPASPALAAAQWRARAGRGLPATDAVGAKLIAQLGGERRIALIDGARTGGALTGALILDGTLAARATAARGDEAGLLRELAYDAGVLHRPSVWKRPWFWIAVSGAAIGAAVAIIAITYQPSVETRLQL